MIFRRQFAEDRRPFGKAVSHGDQTAHREKGSALMCGAQSALGDYPGRRAYVTGWLPPLRVWQSTGQTTQNCCNSCAASPGRLLLADPHRVPHLWTRHAPTASRGGVHRKAVHREFCWVQHTTGNGSARQRDWRRGYGDGAVQTAVPSRSLHFWTTDFAFNGKPYWQKPSTAKLTIHWRLYQHRRRARPAKHAMKRAVY